MGQMGLHSIWAYIHQHSPAVCTTVAAEYEDWTRKKTPTTLPRSLYYRRSGVQRLNKRQREYTHTPPQSQLATDYVETGAKLCECRGGEALGEDIRKLGGGRDMEDPNLTNGNPVANEVQVDLHVFRPLMLNWVG
jgi:hypothetical protein